jgi:hypothetical protein
MPPPSKKFLAGIKELLDPIVYIRQNMNNMIKGELRTINDNCDRINSFEEHATGKNEKQTKTRTDTGRGNPHQRGDTAC